LKAKSPTPSTVTVPIADRVGYGADEAQQRIPAGDQAEAIGPPGSGASGDHQADRFQHPP
jgi:hypothetical protein